MIHSSISIEGAAFSHWSKLLGKTLVKEHEVSLLPMAHNFLLRRKLVGK